MKKVRKALITACGFGTRWLPETKAVQKEMLPIMNRPILDFNLQDCIKAGITDFVIGVSSDHDQIQQYLKPPASLVQHLKQYGKYEKHQELIDQYTQCNFEYSFLDDYLPYGTYRTLLAAEKYLGSEEAFIVFTGDDFIWHKSEESETAHLIELLNKTECEGVVDSVPKPDSELEKYGVLSRDGDGFLDSFVEKPKPGQAPSNLINISKYVFTPKIFEAIRKQQKVSTNPEYILVEAIESMAKSNRIAVHESSGVFLDGGAPESWLQAVLTVAWANPEHQKLIEDTIGDLKSKP